MSRYRVTVLPGEGIGRDVTEAARIVLEGIRLDAEYIPADICWAVWRREGNPLPQADA